MTTRQGNSVHLNSCHGEGAIAPFFPTVEKKTNPHLGVGSTVPSLCPSSLWQQPCSISSADSITTPPPRAELKGRRVLAQPFIFSAPTCLPRESPGSFPRDAGCLPDRLCSNLGRRMEPALWYLAQPHLLAKAGGWAWKARAWASPWLRQPGGRAAARLEENCWEGALSREG